MPLEVPFSPSIVLAVVVVDIVYVSSLATDPSHYLPSTPPGSENPLAAKRVLCTQR